MLDTTIDWDAVIQDLLESLKDVESTLVCNTITDDLTCQKTAILERVSDICTKSNCKTLVQVYEALAQEYCQRKKLAEATKVFEKVMCFS